MRTSLDASVPVTPAEGDGGAPSWGPPAQEQAQPAPAAFIGVPHSHPALESGGTGQQAGDRRGAATRGGPAGFSVLRLSLGGRLLLVAGLIVPLWAAVWLVVR